jgi:DNA-binding transcriptional regulator/RsmH inhibitor MraZ
MAMTDTVLIDPGGRVTLPPQALDVLGHETEVIMELTESGVMLRPKQSLHSITERIAAMNLPVADWPQMEQEIEAGRLTP